MFKINLKLPLASAVEVEIIYSCQGLKMQYYTEYLQLLKNYDSIFGNLQGHISS